jgi:PAS domain S-box-containing protein
MPGLSDMTLQNTGTSFRTLAGPLFGAIARSGMPVLVADARREGHPIIFVNEAFAALTGYSVAETSGRHCHFLEGPETDRAVSDRVSRMLEAGGEAHAEILYYRKNGVAFWNNLHIVSVSEDGAPAYFVATHQDVTAAREARAVQDALAAARQELAEAVEKLRAAQTAAASVIAFEWHVARNRMTGNAPFAALCGLSALEAGEGVDPGVFFTHIYVQDRIRIRLAMGAMLRGAEVFAKEFRLLLPDGTVIWADGRGRSHLDEQDQPVRLSFVLVDITEQKRIEERLRIAQTAGGIGTFEYVPGFGTVSVSPQFCHLLGLHDAQDLPVRTINALVCEGDSPIIDTTVGADMQTGTGSNAECRIVRPDDGQMRWLTRRGEYVQDIETTGLRFSGVIYDITLAKRTEEQLRRLTETLESEVQVRTRERDMVWRTSQDLFIICGFDYNCHSANPAWAKSLGYTPEDLVGKRFDAFVHPDDLKLIARHQAALTDTADFDVRMRAKDGDYRHFSWHVVPEGERFTASGRDITDRKLLEDQLRQSQKMEAVGQLTGGLAHDFNNLLTGISGSLELLQSRIAQGRLKDLDRYIIAAQGAARRAAALTHRLLAFSRQQTLDPKATDVNRLVSGMEELIRRTVGPSIDVLVVPEANVWTTLVDQNQLENALLNLCINARDAMPDGGTLTIETENLFLDESEARRRDLAGGSYVTLCVTDTGMGMTPEVAARAFDPFFTTKPLGQGTGLGLSMIYGFARQSGGQVRIEVSSQDGTAIRLYLPRHEAGDWAHEAAAPEAAHAAPPGRGEVVLVVDDEETVRMLVTEVLHGLGYVAIEAADGPSGLRALQSAARIDLLLTDVGLPGGMNGRQVADMARVFRPALKVLFITGYADKSVLGPGTLDPGMRVLTKPFTIDSLTAEIQELFASEG